MVERALPELESLLPRLAGEKPMATRVASGRVINALAAKVPSLIGGSADLAGSNNTTIAGAASVARGKFVGRNLHFGVREHGMGMILNGIALEGLTRPYGGTFLVFSDYMRPAVRLSALSKLPLMWIWTHDSIGLGEDGPTHQPIEHLAALRAIPHLQVLRPADAMETAECWEIALKSTKRPSILALSRQNLPALRAEYSKENLSAKGAYKIAGDDKADAVIFATGSEVAIAVEALPLLKAKGISGKVISVPSLELFEAQPEDYKGALIGSPKARVAVEAGIGLSWQKLLGEKGHFVGMHSFGASGPAEQLYEYFGITPNGVVEAVTLQL
jgi:transketolase